MTQPPASKDEGKASPVSKNTVLFLDEETKALMQLGFFKPVDAVFFLLIFGLMLLIACGALIQWLNVAAVLVLLLCCVLLAAAWIVTLLYRVCYFVLKLMAAVESMPEDSAVLAAKLLHTSVLSQPSAGR